MSSFLESYQLQHTVFDIGNTDSLMSMNFGKKNNEEKKLTSKLIIKLTINIRYTRFWPKEC